MYRRSFLVLIGAISLLLAAEFREPNFHNPQDVAAHWGPVSGAITIGHGTGGFGLFGPTTFCSTPGSDARTWTWCFKDDGSVPLVRYYYTWNCGASSSFGASQCPDLVSDYNWAIWQPNLPYTTTYKVCTYVPPQHAYTTQARYKVFHAGGVTQINFNQQPFAGWLDLGNYPFNAGTGGYLRLGDSTGEPQATTQVGVSATQFIVHGGPCGSGPLPSDIDVDEWPDGQDNCVSVHNPFQENNDGDGAGDICDPDDDNDTMPDDYESARACLNKWVADGAADPDVDTLPNAAEMANGTDPCDLDTDDDLLNDGPEINIALSNPLNPDTDADGCLDGEEHVSVNANPVLGGDRNPVDFWDFYDVDGTKSVGLSDTLLILSHFGHAANGDALDNILDRYIPNVAQGWRSAESNDGVGLADALANLRSFGHSCIGPPN